MIKILLSGCTGMMGHTITQITQNSEYYKIVAGVNSSGKCEYYYPAYNDLSKVREKFDVIIDFSNFENSISLLDFAKSINKPIILATTGHTKEQIKEIHTFSEHIPILFSANTSIGINLIIDLLNKCVPIIQENNFDIEIIEKHHNKKVDAPSGTALKLANAINEASNTNYDYIYDRYLHNERRSKNEIGIHSIRGGTIAGEHSVIFAGDDEIIEIKHTALSKKIFAKGALNAADFIITKGPGLYSMDDVINK